MYRVFSFVYRTRLQEFLNDFNGEIVTVFHDGSYYVVIAKEQRKK